MPHARPYCPIITIIYNIGGGPPSNLDTEATLQLGLALSKTPYKDMTLDIRGNGLDPVTECDLQRGLSGVKVASWYLKAISFTPLDTDNGHPVL